MTVSFNSENTIYLIYSIDSIRNRRQRQAKVLQNCYNKCLALSYRVSEAFRHQEWCCGELVLDFCFLLLQLNLEFRNRINKPIYEYILDS